MSASAMITYPQQKSDDKIYAEIWIGMKLDYFEILNQKIMLFVCESIHWHYCRKNVCKIIESNASLLCYRVYV